MREERCVVGLTNTILNSVYEKREEKFWNSLRVESVYFPFQECS